MSPSRERNNVIENPDALAVIREEQLTPIDSNPNVDDISKTSAGSKAKPRHMNKLESCPTTCSCQEKGGTKFGAAEVEEMLKEKEAKLRAEFAQQLEREEKSIRERFDFILQNEQVRTSHMLGEAHRERQEKVQALQAQLECKNMAGLMYVMCSERRKSKLEKLRVIEEYTNYIRTLQDILSDGQRLILHLSRGYKTAARVDQEWREKMKIVIKEFQEYVYHFAGGSPDTNQFIFDIPALLKTNAPVEDNPHEDPCDCGDDKDVAGSEGPGAEKSWWERLEGEDRPFVMFGDMAEFKPPQRREVLGTIKAAKTAPPRWKEYVFNEMFLKDSCPNADSIKDEYPKRLPVDKWECRGQKTPEEHSPPDEKYDSRESSFRRYTTTSMEMRAAMGSILRMITASNYACGGQHNTSHRPNLLAARDSMEIASTTKLREKHRESINPANKCISISFGGMQTLHDRSCKDEEEEHTGGEDSEMIISPKESITKTDPIEEGEKTPNALGSLHQDSLQVINGHVPDVDHKINYEKICPMDKCQRLQVDSFLRSLPSYMRASPFTHFEHTFDDYETCSPDQLKIMKQRLEDKKMKGLPVAETEVNPLDEWNPDVDGVGVQTSEMSMSELPPCTCNAPSPTPATSVGRVFNVEDLIPVKEAMDVIHRECFYDNHIEFDRFKVIGQDSDSVCNANEKKDFKQTRVAEIQRILKRHPSLLDLFQGNTRC